MESGSWKTRSTLENIYKSYFFGVVATVMTAIASVNIPSCFLIFCLFVFETGS